MEFFGKELKKITEITKNAVYREGYILENIGKIIFNLNNFSSNYINIHVKKISGDGKFIYQGIEYNIISKVSQVISIPFDYKIEITRPKNSMGEICIIGLSIDTIINKEGVVANWKALIAKCGEYQGIKLVGNKLFATEGALFKQAQHIATLNTIPEEAYSRIDNYIRFNVSAEITSLTLSESVNEIVTKPVVPFPHREPPNPITKPPMTVPPININIPKINDYMCNFIQTKQDINYQSLVVYDSKNVGISRSLFNPSDQLVRHIVSNGQTFIALKKGGLFSFPLSAVSPNEKYLVIISAKRLSGNGKLYVGFSCGNNVKYYFMGIDALFYDKNLSLEALPQDHPDNAIKLNLTMLEDSSGEILIQRIMIIKDIKTVSPFQILNTLASPGSFKSEAGLYRNLNIKESTKKASSFDVEKDNFKTEINCILESTSYSGRQWITKVAPYIKGIKINDQDKLINGVEKSLEIPNLTLSKLGELKVAKRIFIEPWDSSQMPNNKDIEILKQCEVVITSSRINSIMLKSLLGKDVECFNKPWMALKSDFETNNYFIYFEKNENITKELINSWAEAYPKLCIVGTTLDCPFFIKKVSEYLPYSQLFNLLNNAKGLIDFDLINSKSSLLTLAQRIGLPIITNNTNFIEDNYFISCEGSPIKIDIDALLKLFNTEINRNKYNFTIEQFVEDFKNLVGV